MRQDPVRIAGRHGWVATYFKTGLALCRSTPRDSSVQSRGCLHLLTIIESLFQSLEGSRGRSRNRKEGKEESRENGGRNGKLEIGRKKNENKIM